MRVPVPIADLAVRGQGRGIGRGSGERRATLTLEWNSGSCWVEADDPPPPLVYVEEDIEVEFEEGVEPEIVT